MTNSRVVSLTVALAISVIVLTSLEQSGVAQDRKKLEMQLDKQLEHVKKLGEESRCHRAIFLALSNENVRKLVLDTFEDECTVLKDICCLDITRPPEFEFVHFNFDCAPNCFCLVDPGFRVDVDVENEKVKLAEMPYQGPTEPCRSILRMPLPDPVIPLANLGASNAPQDGSIIILRNSPENDGSTLPILRGAIAPTVIILGGVGSSGGGKVFGGSGQVLLGPGGHVLLGGRIPTADLEFVSTVEGVIGSLTEDKVLIRAIGEVPTTGWSNATLSPVSYIIPPPDGIFAFQFVAQRPTGIVNPTVSPISTPKISIERLRKMKGIRVQGDSNDMVLRLLQFAPEGYPEPIAKFEMQGAEIVKGMLQLSVQYAGGIARHDFELFWDGVYMESNPPQVKMRIIHNANDDPGEALLKEELLLALPKLDPCIIRLDDGFGNEKKVRIGLDD